MAGAAAMAGAAYEMAGAAATALITGAAATALTATAFTVGGWLTY